MHFLFFFSYISLSLSLSLSLMQGLRTNYTLPMNELIMDDCHTVQYRGVMIIFVEQFNSKSPPPTTDG